MEKMWSSLAKYPHEHPWLFGIAVFYLLSFFLSTWFFSCGDPAPVLVRVDQ
jgi:hypothetical protein